jgi:hypothetical protein
MLARILWHLAARIIGAHKVTPAMIAAVQASVDEELALLLSEKARA